MYLNASNFYNSYFNETTMIFHHGDPCDASDGPGTGRRGVSQTTCGPETHL